jgi:hypothetical protein
MPVMLKSCLNHLYLGRPMLLLLHGKGKAITLQALTGIEGSRRLGLLDFKTIGT